jgi:putative methylase
MKKKELEILLQKVPSFDSPIPHLEQYLTSADIAADIIFIAHQLGDIENKIVLDLGCGTGIFSVGAFLTGAKKVVGIDIDKNSIGTARDYAEKNNYEIIFKIRDVKDVKIKCDTVIMNPPFGAQKGNRNADRKFIEKGFEIASVLYSLHLSKTVPFVNQLVSSLGGNIDYSKDYTFPIRWMFEFHSKKVVNYDATLLRISTES